VHMGRSWHVAMVLVDGRGPDEAAAKRGPGGWELSLAGRKEVL
jgi:hypothetical protein